MQGAFREVGEKQRVGGKIDGNLRCVCKHLAKKKKYQQKNPTQVPQNSLGQTME